MYRFSFPCIPCLPPSVVQAGKDTTYLLVILGGFMLTGFLFWSVGSEFFSSSSPSSIFTKALKRVKNDPRARCVLWSKPVIQVTNVRFLVWCRILPLEYLETSTQEVSVSCPYMCVYLHDVKQGYHNLSKIASLLSAFSFSKVGPPI